MARAQGGGSETVYEVWTNLDPQHLTEVGLDIFRQWTEFALGATALGGKTIMNPTGRYATSIQFRQQGQAQVAIQANEKIAPEALWLEHGHSEVDLLDKLQAGRSYPMHRGTSGDVWVGTRRGKKMWAKAKAAGFSGYATVPQQRTPGKRNTSNTGPEWTIPAMQAYSPGLILAELVASQFGVGGLP